MKNLKLSLVLIAWLTIVPLVAQSVGAIRYFYDDAGRLTKVVDQNGNVATYTYDGVGNISSIQRSTLPAGSVGIFAFSPQSGPVGQTVVIQGQGFSANPGSNTVRFNGVIASVSAATSGSMTVSVPSGAQSGPISVSVSNQSASSDANFTVTNGTLTSIVVAPNGLYVAASGQRQFTATGMFANGTQQDITASASWSSSNPTAAVVSNTSGSRGLVTFVGSGVPTITASSGAITGSASINLVGSLSISPTSLSIPKALQQQFSAMAVIGTPQDVTRTVTWNSTNPAVATISNAVGGQGLATDVGVGSTTITATLGSVSASTSLTLTPPVPASITVTPTTTTLQPGNTLAFKATARLTDGSNQDETQTSSWSSSDPTVATVSNASGTQGLVTAVGNGTATIAATLGSITGSGTLIVNSGTATVFPRYLYAAGSAISVYGINSNTGQPRINGLVPTSVGPSASALDPLGKFYYVSGTSYTSGTGALAVFSMNTSTGVLTEVPGSPFGVGTSPIAIAPDPSGKFVYVANRSDNTLSGFAINRSTGALTPISGSPFSVAGQPFAVLMHPSGKFLFVTNYTSNVQGSVSVFAIDATTGALSEIAGSPFPVGYNPVAFTSDPSGRFLYVGNSGQNFGSRLLPASPGKFDFATLASRIDTREVQSERESIRSTSPVLLASATFPPTSPLPAGDLTTAWSNPIGFLLPLPFQTGVPTGPCISAFTVNSSTGALTEISNSPFSVSTLQTITSDPAGRYLYSATGFGLIGFGIDAATGNLNPLPDSPYATQVSDFFVTWDPSGQFLYVGYGQTKIQGLALNTNTGALTSIGTFAAGEPFSMAITKGTTSVTYVPEFAYIASASGPAAGGGSGANNVSAYSIDPSSGTLTPITGSPFAEGFSPVSATTDRFGEFLYLSNTCSDAACTTPNGSASVFQINSATGALAAAPGGPFVVGRNPSGVVADPSGRYLYLLNSQDSSISEFSVNQTNGALTAIPGSPFFTASNGSVAGAIDPFDFRMYVLAKCPGCTNGSLYTYGFGVPNNGQLFAPPQSFAVGPSPLALSLDPAASLVLAADGSSNSVYVFADSNGFGSLTQVPGSPFATGQNPVSIAVDPSGRFVLIANQGSNTVSVYAIDPASGSLTPVPGSPFGTGASPVWVTIDYSGKFVYVSNNGDNTISGFSMDSLTGALTPVPGSPFATANAPISVVTVGKTQ